MDPKKRSTRDIGLLFIFTIILVTGTMVVSAVYFSKSYQSLTSDLYYARENLTFTHQELVFCTEDLDEALVQLNESEVVMSRYSRMYQNTSVGLIEINSMYKDVLENYTQLKKDYRKMEDQLEETQDNLSVIKEEYIKYFTQYNTASKQLAQAQEDLAECQSS